LAVAYLGYLWGISAEAQVRVRRRILICSAEDNTSVAVIARVSDWFNDQRLSLRDAVREVLRISSTNWYETPDGRTYIRSWWSAEASVNPYIGSAQDKLLDIMYQAVRSDSTLSALHAFNALLSLRNYNRQMLGERLLRLAMEDGNECAVQLSKLYLNNTKALWRDANVTGQCLYTLLFGPIGPQSDPQPDERHVARLAAQANAQATVPAVPNWCLDGIHVAGADPRFSGSLRHMTAACAAYERFGRLTPDDAWDSETMLSAWQRTSSGQDQENGSS
jgi:hypothetical protein